MNKRIQELVNDLNKDNSIIIFPTPTAQFIFYVEIDINLQIFQNYFKNCIISFKYRSPRF